MNGMEQQQFTIINICLIFTFNTKGCSPSSSQQHDSCRAPLSRNVMKKQKTGALINQVFNTWMMFAKHLNNFKISPPESWQTIFFLSNDLYSVRQCTKNNLTISGPFHTLRYVRKPLKSFLIRSTKKKSIYRILATIAKSTLMQGFSGRLRQFLKMIYYIAQYYIFETPVPAEVLADCYWRRKQGESLDQIVVRVYQQSSLGLGSYWRKIDIFSRNHLSLTTSFNSNTLFQFNMECQKNPKTQVKVQ
ncbi:hypothetical protein ABPG74_005269 [Tetrahymena malaccensis]